MFQSSGGKKHDDGGNGKEKESHKERKRRMQLSAMKSDIDAREKELNEVRQHIADAKKMIYDLTNAINAATISVNSAKQALLLALVKNDSDDEASSSVSGAVEGGALAAADARLQGERKDLRLTTLPRSVLKQILMCVGIRELGRLAQCCRYLSSVCADDAVWEAHAVDPETELLYYCGNRKIRNSKDRSNVKGMPRSTSDYFSPEMTEEPDAFDKFPNKSMHSLSSDGSSSLSSPTSQSDQNLRAVLSPRIGRKRRDRKIQSLLFVKPPRLESSASPQQPGRTRMRTSSQSNSMAGCLPISPMPSSDSTSPRGQLVFGNEQGWQLGLGKSVGEMIVEDKASNAPISTGLSISAPSVETQRNDLASSSNEIAQHSTGRTALDKLFGSGSARHNVIVSVDRSATPMRKRATVCNPLGQNNLMTVIGTLNAKERCKFAPCAYPHDRIDRLPNSFVVPQAKRVKINIMYSRVPSLFFRPQQQPSLMNIVYDFNPAKANNGESLSLPSSINPAMLAERETVQSRLVRYTIYDDYDKQGPHAAVVQLNEMGRDVERCHTFLQVFFRNTNGVVLAYDASVDCAFSRVTSVDMELIRRYCASRNPQIFLVGYITSGSEWQVDLAEVHKYCIVNNVCDLGIVSVTKPSEVANVFSCVSFRVLRPLFKQ